MERKYTEQLERRLGRDLTPTDVERFGNLLFQQAQEPSTPELGSNLDYYIAAARETAPIEEAHIDKTMKLFIEKQKKETKRENKEKRERDVYKQALRKFVLTAATVGAAIGVGIGIYHATETKAAAVAKNIYERKTRELNNKFYGPLDELTTVTEEPTANFQQQRRLFKQYTDKDIADLLNRPEAVKYDNIVNNVRLTAMRDEQFFGENLAFLRTDKDRSKIYSIVTLSRGKCNNDFAGTRACIEEIALFGTKDIKIIRIRDSEVRVLSEGRQVYVSNKIDPYLDATKELLQQFNTLYERGPNVPIQTTK